MDAAPIVRRISHGLLILVALANTAAAQKESSDAKTKKITLASIGVKDDYPESVSGGGLFGDFKPHLRELVARLDKAATDEKIQGVVLRLREPAIGLGKVGELRAAVARVRKTGKKVYADIHAAGMRDYLVASACDQVIMPPSGSLMVPGLEAQVIFFKGLFDKLGIKADFIQIGDYKGAAEPFTRNNMSPEFRKQFEAVIEDYYQYMVESIAADRKLEPAEVKKLIDTGLFSAKAAHEARLVDRIAYEDQWREDLKQELGADELAVERDYGKKKAEELSGMAGMMKLMEMFTGGDQRAKTSKNDKVAVIYAIGPIMTGESTSSFFGGSTMGSDTIVKAFRQAEAEAKVKAIVLRVDSPGGSALASDLIWRQIVTSKKPVIVSMGDIAASGGYYISMGAKKIFAEPGTLTGSIGVVSGKLALRGLLDKIGVGAESIRRGANAGTLSFTDPFTDSEREAMKRTMLDVYEQFTTKAAQGRKMELDKLVSLAGGRLYSGRMAVSAGLADELGTLDDAVADAKKQAGFKADDKVDLWILPQPKSIFEQLLGISSIEAEVRSLSPELVDLLKTTTILQKLFKEPTVTLMPFVVKFN